MFGLPLQPMDADRQLAYTSSNVVLFIGRSSYWSFFWPTQKCGAYFTSFQISTFSK